MVIELNDLDDHINQLIDQKLESYSNTDTVNALVDSKLSSYTPTNQLTEFVNNAKTNNPPPYFKILPDGTDLNYLLDSGIYITRGNLINGYIADWSMILVVNTGGTVGQYQITDTSKIYTRHNNGGTTTTWVSWKVIFQY